MSLVQSVDFDHSPQRPGSGADGGGSPGAPGGGAPLAGAGGDNIGNPPAPPTKITQAPPPSEAAARAAFFKEFARYITPVPWAHIQQLNSEASKYTPVLQVCEPPPADDAAKTSDEDGSRVPPLPPPRKPQATPPRPPTLPTASRLPATEAAQAVTVRFTSAPLGVTIKHNRVTHVGQRSPAWQLVREGALLVSVGGVPTASMHSPALISAELRAGSTALRKMALGIGDQTGILDDSSAFVLEFLNPSEYE